jgi:hypothetical protein
MAIRNMYAAVRTLITNLVHISLSKKKGGSKMVIII